MAPFVWRKAPMAVVQSYESRNGTSRLQQCTLWAAWAVESLHYLDDVDQSQTSYPARRDGYSPETIDIAHVRWATSTAVSSLDLCAAALGHAFRSTSGRRELDLRDLDLNSGRTKRVVRRRRRAMPREVIDWLDGVLNDTRYADIHWARNDFTHSWLRRHLQRGGEDGHRGRTKFEVGNNELGARVLIEWARDLATERVAAFMDVLDGI